MNKKASFLLYFTILCIAVSSCSKSTGNGSYPKEDAGNTNYGTSVKSALYIDDFYFMSVGCEKALIENTVGSAHYNSSGNSLFPVYTLQNGDTISIEYDGKTNKVKSAKYENADGEVSNFFNILVDIGILKSADEEHTNVITVVPDGEENPNGTETENNKPGVPDTQTAVQGEVFAKGLYSFTLIKPELFKGMVRSEFIKSIGKPNYFFSHNFNNESYIIDCYNLNDGSKLYLDYGYERIYLRCAAIYKNGTYKSVLGSVPWSAQTRPVGFTRDAVDTDKVSRLAKNLTPAKVYSILGEPAWYEGNRGSYSDVYPLNSNALAYLNFGTAHNKLISISIKDEDGKVTVITPK